jgi:hypothetical protein
MRILADIRRLAQPTAPRVHARVRSGVPISISISKDGKASVPGRGPLKNQPVTHYYDDRRRLSDGRGVDRHHKPDAVELLRRRHAEAHPVRLDSSGAGPSDLRHCYMCETRDGGQWYYWPPKGGPNRGQPPHHRVCAACKTSLATSSLVKEEHRASRCGVDYQCPDGACGPDGLR